MVALGRREVPGADDVSSVGSFLQEGSGVPKTRGPEAFQGNLWPEGCFWETWREIRTRELRVAVPVPG